MGELRTNQLLRKSHSLADFHPTASSPRSLSTDTKINLIIGVFTIVTGILSLLLGWAMWRISLDRRRRHGHGHESI
jgi:hypothetical protein